MAMKSSVLLQSSRSVRCFSPLFSSIKLKGVCSKKSPSGAVRTEEEVKDMFLEWARKHGKSYETESEKEKRFKVFRQSLRRADLNYSIGKPLQLNDLSDLTDDEIEAYNPNGSLVAFTLPLDPSEDALWRLYIS